MKVDGFFWDGYRSVGEGDYIICVRGAEAAPFLNPEDQEWKMRLIRVVSREVTKIMADHLGLPSPEPKQCD